jgi:hypothetical protein
MRILLFLLGLILPIMASEARSQELYQWTDETGRVNIVGELGQVPERYRAEIKVYRRSSGKTKRSPAEKEEVSESAPEIVPKEEEPEPSAPTPQERNARVEDLRREKDELEGERRHQWILIRRFGRYAGARATLYKNRVKKLDEHIEAVQKELDAIRQEGK